MQGFLTALFVVVLWNGSHGMDPLSDDFIDYINTVQSTWKAQRNFHKDLPFSYLKGLMGYRRGSANLPSKVYDAEIIANLPENFDPRDKWTSCKSLSEIRDQGRCGSCWAISSSEMMTDRYCIASNGTKNVHFSTENVISCCTECGIGCQGGDPALVMQYWQSTGVVSGGNYGSGEGCVPYSIHPCNHVDKEATDYCNGYGPTPSCKKSCQENYTLSYNNDLKYGKSPYKVEGEENIKAELVHKGPVVTGFLVYPDFLHYKSGVYKQVDGKFLGGHAVKLIGYGVENGTKYWLVANSWNESWGDKGYFKIIRGVNECHFEDHVVTNDPKFD